MRSVVIRNFRGIVSAFPQEGNLVYRWYHAKGEFFNSFLYPNFIYKQTSFENNNKKNKITIQVSHFADPRGKHLEVFELLKNLKNDRIEVMCPLVYGDVDYGKKVISRGNELFESNFSYQLALLPVDDYVKLLNKIDIAVFAHDGNLAGGNMIYLIGLGKKVYLRSDTAAHDFFKSIGLRLYDIDNEFNSLTEPISKNDALNNIQIIKKYFTEENLIKQWGEVFNS